MTASPEPATDAPPAAPPPPTFADRVLQARTTIRAAADTWGDLPALALEALIQMGQPSELLGTQRQTTATAASARRGAAVHRTSSAVEYARAEVLGAWRSISRAFVGLGGLLPAPSDVFACVEGTPHHPHIDRHGAGARASAIQAGHSVLCAEFGTDPKCPGPGPEADR